MLRLYEIWLRTGSARARGLLAQLGVAAAPVALQLALGAPWSCKSCRACSQRIYDVPLAHDVAQFLLTDRSALPAEFAAHRER